VFRRETNRADSVSVVQHVEHALDVAVFSLPVNAFEYIELDSGMNDKSMADDPNLIDKKRKIMLLNGLPEKARIGADGVLPEEFLHSLRCKQLSDEDVRHLSQWKYKFLPANGFFSVQNELKVHTELTSSVEALLQAYPTRVRQDLDLLENLVHDPLYRNLRYVVSYRLSIKRILHALVLRSLSAIDRLFGDVVRRWDDLPLPSGPQAPEQAEMTEWKQSLSEWNRRIEEWRQLWNRWVLQLYGGASSVKDLPFSFA